MNNESFIYEWIRNKKPIIDCRKKEDFEKKHIKNSANIPVEDLFHRMHELPKKVESFWVIVHEETHLLAHDFFCERQFNVEGFIDWKSELLTQLPDNYFGCGFNNIRFWQPTPFVKYVNDHYFKNNTKLKVLDIACGSGRDAIYLAEQGYDVTALDYSETALQRCKSSASLRHVDVNTQCVNLEKSFKLSQLPIHKQYDLIIVCRYLYRPLLPKIKEWLDTDGLLVYQTFVKADYEYKTPRNPAYLLEPNELREEFFDYKILMDDVELLDEAIDKPRIVSKFIAQKK